MTSKVADYADWSINNLFCELISYVQSNIEDGVTETMKAAILAKACVKGAVGTIIIRVPGNTGNYEIDHFTLTHEEYPHEWNEYLLVPVSAPKEKL